MQRSEVATDRRSIRVGLTAKGKALGAKFESTGIRQLDQDLAKKLGGNPEKTLAVLGAIRDSVLLELDEK